MKAVILLLVFMLVSLGVVSVLPAAVPDTSQPSSTTPTAASTLIASGSNEPAPVRRPNQLTHGAARLAAGGGAIKLAWFYKPPNGGNTTELLTRFNTFILTQNDEPVRDALMEDGVKGPILQYLRFDAIMDPGSCRATPWGNQVAYQPGDFCRIREQHPDWFLTDESGNRIHVGENFYMMDPGNQRWQEFWLERAIQSQEELGWDGVFMDNIEASLERFERKGGGVKQYDSDEEFQEAVEGFLKAIYTGYFQPENRPLAGNIIYIRDSEVWYRYLAYMDGAMEETFALDWHFDYLPVSTWEEHLTRAERTQQMGRFVYLISQGQRDSWKRQRFAFGSYLLVTQGRAAFRYSNPDHYADYWPYDSYNFNPGLPLGPRYQLDDGNWRRDFTGGYVLVDPSARDATFVYADLLEELHVRQYR